MVSTNTPTDKEHAAASAHEPATQPDRGPITSPTVEHQALTRLAHALQAVQSDAVKIVVGEEPPLDVPPSLVRVLRRGATTLAQDNAVTMGQVGKLLTIGQAAEILMMSRAYLITKLDSGELPSVLIGDERRVPRFSN